MIIDRQREKLESSGKNQSYFSKKGGQIKTPVTVKKGGKRQERIPYGGTGVNGFG